VTPSASNSFGASRSWTSSRHVTCCGCGFYLYIGTTLQVALKAASGSHDNHPPLQVLICVAHCVKGPNSIQDCLRLQDCIQDCIQDCNQDCNQLEDCL
jgi:hypothetical protein